MPSWLYSLLFQTHSFCVHLTWLYNPHNHIKNLKVNQVLPSHLLQNLYHLHDEVLRESVSLFTSLVHIPSIPIACLFLIMVFELLSQPHNWLIRLHPSNRWYCPKVQILIFLPRYQQLDIRIISKLLGKKIQSFSGSSPVYKLLPT